MRIGYPFYPLALVRHLISPASGPVAASIGAPVIEKGGDPTSRP